MTSSRQTVIPLSVVGSNSFDSFYSDENQQLIEQLRLLVAGLRQNRMIYFYGEHGAGKTHLLHSCIDYARNLDRNHLFLSTDDNPDPPDFLQQLNPDTVVCIDNLHAIANHDEWQRSLFNIYERISAGNGAIVVAATKPLSILQLSLPDLASRFSSGGVYCLQPLGENARGEALKMSAKRRGFDLPDSVLNFIMTHYDRDTAALFSLLDRIDSLSLAEQRKITVPFVKKLL